MLIKSLDQKINDIRIELIEYNLLASQPNVSDKIIEKKNKLYQEYVRLNNLVIIRNTKKEKRTNRQVKFFSN